MGTAASDGYHRVGAEPIGGIGHGGARLAEGVLRCIRGNFDDDCARAALAKIKDRMKR